MATKYDKDTLTAIVQEYHNTDQTLEEVGLSYSVSPTTLSRHSAELGYTTLRSYKTARERELLEYLSRRGIKNLQDAVKVI